MKNNNYSNLILSVSFAIIGGLCGAYCDQPASTISPTGTQKFAVDLDDGTDGELTYSTSEVPNPKCPDDAPDGDPDWFWDYGDNLDATNNDDGTLTVKTDVEASYSLTVYCQQLYDSSDGSGSYEVQTQTSVPLN